MMTMYEDHLDSLEVAQLDAEAEVVACYGFQATPLYTTVSAKTSLTVGHRSRACRALISLSGLTQLHKGSQGILA